MVSYRVQLPRLIMTITLYGIPNCDTVKKARTWLADQQQEFTFHDFKKQGLTREIVAGWLKQLSRDVLVNRKGTTWRALSDERKASIVDDEAAIALMLENPSVIKRPVMDNHGAFSVGFSDAQYQQIFNR
ncbi:arsenate reductase [Duganella sp. OV458]|jgi:arsenate reductase|nr:arsenate reductase [Duganella sp. OV458]SDI75861.1 arsenate reductase [Duganella sp. OV510]